MNEGRSDSLVFPKDGLKISVKDIHQNVSPNLILITEDRLALIIHKHLDSMREKKEWITPLGVLLTLVVTLTTAEFKLFIWSKDTWHAIYILSAFLSFAWFISSAIRAFRAKSIDGLVEEIKRGSTDG